MARSAWWFSLLLLGPFGLASLASAAVQASTQRVSLADDGSEAAGDSEFTWISADGRYVVFSCAADGLVPGDQNGLPDTYLRDRVAGTTTRISEGLGGAESQDLSFSGSISDCGRWIAFASNAENLVPGDSNRARDIFVRDLQLGVTTRVSVSSAGDQANGFSFSPRISPDGRFVVFKSLASDLVAGDSNGKNDLFLHDRNTGQTDCLSLSPSGQIANAASARPDLSADGRYVIFKSFASNLVAGDTNGKWDAFLFDREQGALRRVPESVQGNGHTIRPVISADGQWVAFESEASNLVPGDTQGHADIFLVALASGVITRVSLGQNGAEANGPSGFPAISADGRWIAFQSEATNLVAGDTNAAADIFLHDRIRAETIRVSIADGGAEANGASASPWISEDGLSVVFTSLASNLVAADTNQEQDIFVREWEPSLSIRLEPAVAGVTNDLTVSGATPGASVHVGWSLELGSRDIPGCPGWTAVLDRPKQLSGLADATGTLVLSRAVAASTAGLCVYLQAVEPASCRVGELLAVRLQ